ncbi:MAG TPA: hypothetical protein VMV40_03710 [Acidiferrobacter sp.]|nr:hypothetical protein [Acidiferrobacter sp.]
MDLEEMIKVGPDPSRGIGALVLRRFRDIERARQQRWRWSEVAEGLGLPADRGRAIGEAFNRISRKVATGAMKPIDGDPKTGVGKGKAVASKVDQDTGFRTPTPKEKEADADDRKWM